MPIYTYKGYDSNTGASRKGKVEAESLRAARQRLRQKDKVIASELKEEVAMSKVKEKKPLFSPGVSLQDVAIMTRQFATLQRAHVPLDDSLRALTQQVDSMMLRNTLSAVKDSVSEGKSVAEAMVAYPTVFNRLYVNMVRAGESSGNLDLVLERLADFMEYQVAIRGKVFSALSYPLLMMTASMAIIAYLFISVVPKLQKIFTKLKVELPWYTKGLISFSDFLQNQWYIVIIVMVGLYFAGKFWYQSARGRQLFDQWSLGAPIFGPIVLRINVSKFTKTLSTLLGSGVPIITALEITRNIIGNKVLSKVVETSRLAVQEGESLGATIERSGKFPPLVTHMIKTGEKTGELERMLTHVSDAYDAEVERKIQAMISMIEPAMIIVMGGVVSLVVVAMLVPMLSVMRTMQ